MDLIKLNISPDFIQKRTHMTWNEALFGIDNELLSSEAAVDFAAEQLVEQDNVDSALVELAGLAKGESTRDLVERLAGAEQQQDPESIRSKWLYLALGWIFEHKEIYPDPLRTVEEVYADFDYPDAIVSFVRYMPTNEPDLGNREANERRLYENWKRYLANASGEFRT